MFSCKRFFRTLVHAFVSTFFCCAAFVVLAPVSLGAEAEPAMVEEEMALQQHACGAHDCLMNAWFDGTEIHYPDYFGGDYVDGDTLHIRLVDPSEAELQEITELVFDYLDYVAFEDGTISFDTFHLLAKRLFYAMHRAGISPVSVRPSSQTERLTVSVPETYAKQAVEIITTSDHAGRIDLQFDQEESLSADVPNTFEIFAEMNAAVSHMIGGDVLSVSEGNFTLGYMGTLDGNDYYVSSGHAITNGETVRKGSNMSGEW